MKVIPNVPKFNESWWILLFFIWRVPTLFQIRSSYGHHGDKLYNQGHLDNLLPKFIYCNKAVAISNIGIQEVLNNKSKLIKLGGK